MQSVLFMLFVCAVAVGAFAGEITSFNVSESGGVGPQKRYVRGGIPIPEGKVKSLDKLAVLDASGKEVPAEFTKLASWLDGSAKWVLVEFADTCAAGQSRKYSFAEVGEKTRLQNTFAGASEPDFDKVSEIVLEGETQSFVREQNTVKVITDSPVKKSWILTGTLLGMKDKSERADYYCRVDRVAGVPGLTIRFTLTSTCAGESLNIRELSLKFPGAGPYDRVFYEQDGIREEAIAVKPVEKRVRQKTDRSMKGWFAATGRDGTVTLTCEDFAELCPVAFCADKENLKIKLYDGADGPYEMTQGSATTHHLRLMSSDIKDNNQVREAGIAALNVLMPVCSSDWYCASKAFGNIAKADPAKFPRFERIVESDFEWVMRNRVARNEYGIKDYGDYVHAGHWGNQHYDLPWVMLQQFARSGELRFFNCGVAAARHMIDVDTIWFNSNPNMVGGVYVEQKEHNLSRGTYMGFAKNHGPLVYYYLTGDERALEAGKITGDYCTYWSKNPNNIIGTEERVAGYGLMCLNEAYLATQDKKYLSAARDLIQIILDWQDKNTGAWVVKPENAGSPRPESDTGGCVFMLGGFFEAMIDYYEITKEQDVRDAIIKGNEYLIKTLWKNGPEKYSIDLLVVHAPAWCYVQTKDKMFIDAARNAYGFATANSGRNWVDGKMLAQHWRAAARFLYVIENDQELLKLGEY